MFDNIGGKIKTVAATVAWIGIALSCLTGFILIVQGLDVDEMLIVYGLLVAVLGSLLSWLGSLTLYGFGQLIENSDILVEQGQKQNPTAPAAPAHSTPAPAPAPSATVPPYGAPVVIEAEAKEGAYANQCTRCGKMQSKNNHHCIQCGARFTNI